MQKYGGTANAVGIDEVQEAEVFTTPPRAYSTLEKLLVLPVGIIKLLPITLLLMAIWGVVCFLIVGF